MSPRIAAIVPAAGSGQRLGAPIPKALVLLGGRPLLAHAVAALAASGVVGEVVVVAPPGPAQAFAEAGLAGAGGIPLRVVAGGASRDASVANGLAVLAEADYVLVHDAARALVPPAVVRAVVEALLSGAPAVVPGLAVTDTIREIAADGTSRTLDRAALRAVQTPQGFAADVLRAAHAGGPHALVTDDAGMVEAMGVPITIVPGHPEALKVTTALDLVLAEQILAGRTKEESQ